MTTRISCCSTCGSETELPRDGRHKYAAGWAVAGAVAPVNAARLACEPLRPWIAGMAVGQSGTGSDMSQEASA